MVNPADRLEIGTEQGRIKAEIEFCSVLNRAFDLSGKPRKQIADELGKRLGRTVTEGMLNDFTRIGERERAPRFPAAWIPDLCAVLEDGSPQRHLLTPAQLAALELGEWAIQSRWVLEQVQLEPGKSLTKELRKKQISKRPRGAGKQ